MIEQTNGAVCTIGDSNTTMKTYRLSADQWTTVTGAFSTAQTDYQTKMANIDGVGATTLITIGGTAPDDGLDYMDQMNCSSSENNVFECKGWQPDHSNDGASAGYPRFGLKETIYAGIIDESLSTAAVFEEIILTNAVSLAAAGAAAMTLLSF